MPFRTRGRLQMVAEHTANFVGQ